MTGRPKKDANDLYVVKVKRPGGGFSIIDISPKYKAEELAKEFNFQYQTDTYYTEPYAPQDEYGAPHEDNKEQRAYPDNGKP